MRTAIIILASITANVSPGQLVNGSFEDGMDGWQVPNYVGLDAVSLSTEVPTGGGVQSMAMHINGYDVAFENIIFQPVGNFAPGTVVQFGGWMRTLVPIYAMDTPPTITFCTCDSNGYAIPVGPDLFYTGPHYSWTFHQATLTIADQLPTGTTHCLKLGGGVVYQNLNFQAWFDHLFFQVDESTGTADISPLGALHFRPNPATDKLWVDLPEVPTSITAVDATGRTFQLRSFQQTGRTLEVDVSSVPPGLCVMLLKTNSGDRTLRFIKASFNAYARLRRSRP